MKQEYWWTLEETKHGTGGPKMSSAYCTATVHSEPPDGVHPLVQDNNVDLDFMLGNSV